MKRPVRSYHGDVSNHSDHIEEALVDAWRDVLREEPTMRKLALADLQWLSMSDLEQLTGFSVQTLEKWLKKGWIRMFRPGDSREWRTTLRMWREDQAILIEAGMLDGRGNKPTISERKKRISELQRKKLHVLGSEKAAA